MHPSKIRLTVGELKEMLSLFSEDAEVDFGGVAGTPLEFHRMKPSGENLVQIELQGCAPGSHLRVLNGDN